MPLDVETAYKFLIAQPTVFPGILVAGGASCGVNQSVHLSMKRAEIKALVLLSEITDLDGRSFLRAHPSLPLFLATAEDDTDPGVSDLMQSLSTFSTNAHTRFVRYKTGGHGVEIFAAHPGLPATIVDWVTIAVRSPNVATAKGPPNVSPETQFLDSLDQPGAAANSAQLYAAATGKKSEWPRWFPSWSSIALATIIFRSATKRARSPFSHLRPASTPIHPMLRQPRRRVPCRRAKRFGAAECAEGH